MMRSQTSQAVSNFAAECDFANKSPSDMFLLALYYKTDIAGVNLAGTNDAKEVYAELDISIPSNFGGEIRSLRNQKLIGRNNLIVTKKGHEYCKSTFSVSGQPKDKKHDKNGDRPVMTVSINTLHPNIKDVSTELYNDGHYPQAVFEAYKAVVNEVKSICGITNLDGKPLMEKAFSLNSPIIKLNPMISLSDRDEQQGFMFLFSGAALGIRNPKAHANIVTKDQRRTLEYLTFASLLMSRLDERVA